MEERVGSGGRANREQRVLGAGKNRHILNKMQEEPATPSAKARHCSSIAMRPRAEEMPLWRLEAPV